MKKIMTSIRLNDETLRKFKEYAEQHDLTLTSLIKIAVSEYIERHK